MTCHDMNELISAYLDGETTAEETERAERHLAECEACRRRIEDYREMDGLLADLPDVGAAPSFAEELNRRKGASGRVITLFRSKVISIAAMVVVVVTLGLVTGIGLLSQNGESPAGEPLPNLDLLADAEFLGIGRYTMETSAAMSSMGVNELVPENTDTNTKEGV